MKFSIFSLPGYFIFSLLLVASPMNAVAASYDSSHRSAGSQTRPGPDWGTGDGHLATPLFQPGNTTP